MTIPSHSLCAACWILTAGFLLTLAGCTNTPAPLPAWTAQQPCPQWVKFPANHHSNADSPFLGCISDANLKAMVADPADLARGRPLGPADGERETRAIEAYQQGKVKPLEGSGTTTSSTSSTSSSGGGTQ